MLRKTEVLDLLIVPIVEVFGDLPETSIDAVVDEARNYSKGELSKAANKMILTLDRKPYPVHFLKALRECKEWSPFG